MNSYLRMASLAAALLWAAAVLVIAQPVQAAMVTTNFYSNTLNDSSYLDVLVPGSPTYLITGSFSFEFDETRTEPNNGPQFPVFSFTMDIGGSLFGAEYFAVYAAQPNVFNGVFLSGPSGSNPQQPIQLPYFGITFLMNSNGDIGVPGIHPKFSLIIAEGTHESRQIFFRSIARSDPTSVSAFHLCDCGSRFARVVAARGAVIRECAGAWRVHGLAQETARCTRGLITRPSTAPTTARTPVVERPHGVAPCSHLLEEGRPMDGPHVRYSISCASRSGGKTRSSRRRHETRHFIST